MSNCDRPAASSSGGGHARFYTIPICENTQSAEKPCGGNVNATSSTPFATLGIDRVNLDIAFGIEGDVTAIAETGAGVDLPGGNLNGCLNGNISAFGSAGCIEISCCNGSCLAVEGDVTACTRSGTGIDVTSGDITGCIERDRSPIPLVISSRKRPCTCIDCPAFAGNSYPRWGSNITTVYVSIRTQGNRGVTRSGDVCGGSDRSRSCLNCYRIFKRNVVGDGNVGGAIGATDGNRTKAIKDGVNLCCC